jgi:FtsH-binding integral membrane protein
MNPYESPTFDVVAAQDETTRVSFVRKTYWHLAGAVAAFALIEYMLLNAGLESAVFSLLSASKYSWLMVMGAFMAVSWIAEKWANSDTSLGMQYFGLSVYVVAQALIMLPLLMIANGMENGVIAKAGMVTVAMVLGLTLIAFTTRKDFSFLGGMLKIGGMVALGVIVASFFLPITLGTWFSALMILFASGSILYSTSNIMYHYRTTQHVAASLSLFAGVALLFWYVLRLFMSRD